MTEVLKKTESLSIRKTVSPQAKGKWYTDDELNNLIISEYEKFRSSQDKQIRDAFEHNYSLAKASCEELYNKLQHDLKFTCKSIHLRYTSYETFDAILQIPAEIFMSDKFDEAFKKSLEISTKYNNSKFDIEFHFMPSSKKVNSHALVSDGYYITYKIVNVNKKAPTRKA